MGDIGKLGPRQIATIAVMAALTTVATISFVIPFPATGGYFNLGDTIVVVTSLLFGPIVGALAGGIGSGLADFMGGWMLFIIPTTIIKGFEGFIIAYLAGNKDNRPISRIIMAWIVGAATIVIGYFIAEAFFLGIGIEAATAEIAINIPQALSSSIGVVIYLAVKDRVKL